MSGNMDIRSKEDIYRILYEIFEEMFEIPKEKLKPDAKLYEDLDIDSIDAVDLVVKLSQMTGKRMRPEAFKSIRTIDDVVNALETLLLEDKV